MNQDSIPEARAREATPEETREDIRAQATVLRALALLDSSQGPADSEVDHELVAQYVETWAALPHLLEPVQPRPETKEAILRNLVAAPVAGDVVPFRRPEPASPSGAPGPSKGLWALAAGLAAAVVGLSLLSFNLQEKVVTLGQQVDEQEAALASLLQPAPLGHMEAELTAADFTYRDLPQPTFSDVTLRQSLFFQVASGPTDGSRNGAAASVDGAMLVCAKHRRWLLHLQGLQPLGNDQQYHLWFVTDQGPVHVGQMPMGPDRTAQASADRIPPSVIGLLISREDPAAVGPRPAGPILARATRPVEI